MTKYYVDLTGNYIGGFDGVQPPAGSVEVPAPPADARQKWNGLSFNALTASDIDAEATQRANFAIDGKALKALALVVADLHSLTPTQIRTLFIDKFKTL